MQPARQNQSLQKPWDAELIWKYDIYTPRDPAED